VGYLLLIGAICAAAVHCLQGGPCLGAADLQALAAAAAGVGLIAARDGGH